VSQVRVHNFSVSPDGSGTGAGQSLDALPDLGQLSAHRSAVEAVEGLSGVGGSTPAAGRAGRASLMAELLKDGTPGAVSHE
jgi:hypothetical protein